MTMLIDGAEYLWQGQFCTLLGVKRRTIVIRIIGEDAAIEIPREAADQLEPTGVHDHDHYCCPEHNTHSSPHSGCLLR
jgi:hypothetical protein